MSMWNADVVDLILNDSVSPTLTLWLVAKPWIVELPSPSTSQLSGSLPVLVFSQAILFVTGVVQASARAARGATMASVNSSAAASIRLERREKGKVREVMSRGPLACGGAVNRACRIHTSNAIKAARCLLSPPH